MEHEEQKPLYKDIKFYHANRENRGSALSLRIARRENTGVMGLTFDVAQQLDKNSFDWRNKIVVMLNITEVANLTNFNYFDNSNEKLDIYHKSSSGSIKTIVFNRKDYGLTAYFTSTDENGAKNTISAVLFKNELLIIKEIFSAMVAEIII